MRQGLCVANPVINTERPRAAKKRDRVLSNDEIVSIWNACGDDDYGKCVRLLILTGARRQEIGSMQFKEFDFKHKTWTLPAERSKNGLAHTLPLLPDMLAIIESVPRTASRDTLFGTRANGFVRWSGGKKEIDVGSGVKRWRTHDIRRSVATKLGEDLGVLPHVIEALLNHQSGFRRGDAGVYNQSRYEREVRNALAMWHDRLRTLVDGGERKVVVMIA
jgi:integrase